MDTSLTTCLAQLQKLSELEPDPWKSRAYLNASRTLTTLTQSEFNSRMEFKDLPYIGTAINKKLIEFKQTGQIHKLTKLQYNYGT